MRKKVIQLLPHGAILISNMFVVFYLIDRVNKAMNFIDNGLTKGLLFVMCLIALFDALTLRATTPRRALPIVNGALCGITLVLMLVDLIWPGASLFTNEIVKLILLIACLVTTAASVALIARRRRRLRQRRQRIRWKQRPLWMICLFHVLALGVALLLYALPHHVIPHGEASVGIVTTRRSVEAAPTVAAEVEPTEVPTETKAETAIEPEIQTEVATVTQPVQEDSAALAAMFGEEAVGSFRSKFEGRFTGGGVEQTEGSYRSENVCVTITNKYVDEMRSQVYVADIYVADISCLMTAFATDRYGRGYTEWIEDVATRYKSVVTLNGDYYGSRSMGVIIRNGELYRDKKYKGDILVLYWDGHMEAIRSSKFDTMDEINKGAYQSWSFGPSLLDGNGKVLKDFNCDNYLRNKHPRSAIGYFEPGHYCLVAVDGRNEESAGSTLTELATLLSNMGCKLGYNLDGGQTSLMAAGSKLINHPSQGGRDSSDYIMIVDRITQ